jgi:hypothetical protein
MKVICIKYRTHHDTKEIIMSPAKRYAKKQAKARQRRRHNAQERLKGDRRQAQRVADALHHALEDLGLPDTLVSEIEGRLRSQQKLLGKIVGVMFPALFGCRTPSEMMHIHHQHQGTLLVEGKVSYTFTLADGRHVNGHDFLEDECPWRYHPWEARVRYVRLQAKSPTYGAVTVPVVDEPGQDRFYLLCLETTLSAPVLIHRWRRRNWIEFVFRVLKHLLATESCQAHSEDAYYGHFVLRLMGSFVLFYTSRVICKGRMTMEEIIFSLKHYWRFVDLEALELQALS